MKQPRPPLHSPWVRTIELDKSDKFSVWAKTTRPDRGGGTGSGTNLQNPTPHPTPVVTFFLLQEDGFFILQEDDSKIKL